MTEGTSQGLFIVVAIVIFGIFVALSYTLFGKEGLTNDLKMLFEDGMEQTQNKKLTNILKDEDTRQILTNNKDLVPVKTDILNENGESYQRIKLSSTAIGKHISLHSPMFSPDIDTESLIGEDVTLSLSYRFENPIRKINVSYRFYDDISTTSGTPTIIKGVNGWSNLSLTINNLQDKELNNDAYFGFLTLAIQTDELDFEYLDLKDINLSIMK